MSTPVHVPNKKLRTQRLLRGWSLDDAASAVLELGRQVGERNLALNGKTVGRWERGESHPRAPYPKLLCALFSSTSEELGLAGDGAELTSPLTLSRPLYPRPDPRLFAEALSTGLVAPMVEALQRLNGGSHAARFESRGIDQDSIELLSQLAGLLRRLDDRLGAPAVARCALELRAMVEHLGLFASVDEKVKNRLRSVSGEVSQFLGWLAFDAGDNSTARGYYQEALAAARDADDQELLHCVLAHVAWLAATEDKLPEAVSIVDAHFQRPNKRIGSLMRSWLSAVQAEIRALRGESQACLTLLQSAHKKFERARFETAVPLIYFFDRAELSAYEASCMERIGQPEQASTLWQEALSLLPPNQIRDKARYLVHLAGVCCRRGEIDKSCCLAVEALTLAVETSSTRTRSLVERLRVQLDPWKETAAVRQLEDHLLVER